MKTPPSFIAMQMLMALHRTGSHTSHLENLEPWTAANRMARAHFTSDALERRGLMRWNPKAQKMELTQAGRRLAAKTARAARKKQEKRNAG